MRKHPFDLQYGIETSGLVPAWMLRTGTNADAHAHAGCQPSCLRRALSILPEPERLTFVDLGCGKERVLVVASERPFSRILGIELAPSLVAIAKRNSQIIGRVHLQRATIEVSEGDASAASFPAGDLAIFLYHSFGRQLVQRLVDRMVDLGRQADREIFFIYENPVYGGIVDETKRFTKRFETVVPCTPEEQGFAPDDPDKIAVWQFTGPSR
jgi:SAM-dependent methyltransferase